ncbi:SDR family oxidoreductase [Rhizobium fabae]|uniref:NAD(P)-dependent dehydrogenase (Short-subunit alcohol dehydrogenase family) n=1 Tax=Rhizobium fabae TaxID=573179 RepID=A0A7W6BDC7_9HYPH|nr:SDR family oxidoreductase [Rhizobium fabae]MBB3916832.1 NAD(P)-dependent dehydrogenase (short-subunit alcohol dehydrogenase family) [Rhizobium fabae]RUM10863.1 SDR family oxidoreductase [Rhizobium fabae]
MSPATLPRRYPEMEGKVALVTGGTSGIGLATAQAFAHEGAIVVIASREEKRASAALKSIQGQASWIACDVSDGKRVEKLIAATLDRHGKLDYAFNNGGSGGAGRPVGKMSEEAWRKTIDGFLTSAFLCMRHQIPTMLKNGAGVIVNNSSVDGLRGYPFPGGAAYAAAKHGVLGLTRSAALEYAKSGLRITAVCPGWIDTPPITSFVKKDAKLGESIVAQEPIGRLGTAAEVANGVLWLCSDAASFMLGSPLVLDGGYMA